MTNSTGIVQQESTYYPFGGEQRMITDTVDNRYKFTGLERDSESGLDHTLFRMYPSNLARCLSPDPVAGDILNPQSLNRYAYVANDPINFIDPLGLRYAWEKELRDDPFNSFGLAEYLFGQPYVYNAYAERPHSDFFNVFGLSGSVSTGGRGGGAGSGCSDAQQRALQTILANPDCLDFILSTIGKAYAQDPAHTRSVAAARLAATSPTAFVNTLAGAQIVAGPYLGEGVAAQANYVNTITTAPLFNTFGTAAQATVLIHETFHLVPYPFTDEGLARTIGWQRPDGIEPGTDLSIRLASAAFTKELAKHCGW